MLLDRILNPGPPTYESGALPIALCGLAGHLKNTGVTLIRHVSGRHSNEGHNVFL